MEKLILKVSGMTCLGCVNSVRKVLEPIAGVNSVEVSLEKGQAAIQYDSAKANVNQFKIAIEEAGYEVAG